MALTDNEMVMPVAPAYGGGNNGFGFGGDGAWWLLVLFLFAFSGGWGGGFGGNGAMPFVVNNDVQRGFDQNAIMGGLNGLTAAVTNGFANAEISRANTNTATLQALWNMQMQQQNCCCDTRAAIASLAGTVASEGCETRYANAQNTRDIIEAANMNRQVLMDKICALELDAKNDRIDELQRLLTAANFNASQIAQTSEIITALTPVA